MKIENLLTLWLMAKMREIVNLGKVEEVKLVFKCFFVFVFFFLPAASGAEGRTPETLMTLFILTVVQGFILCKACSHMFLFDSCNNTMSLISCHSLPRYSHMSLLLFLDPVKLLLALGPLHMFSLCLGMFSPTPTFPPFFLKYHSLRRCSLTSQIKLYLPVVVVVVICIL